MRQVIFILSLLFCTASHAEIYQGIRPESTLGDIKRLFPNANFSKVKAAWVTEEDGFYSMTGEGLSGKIYLAFSDRRPFQRERIAAFAQRLAEAQQDPQTDKTPDTIKAITDMSRSYEKWAAEPDDVALVITWVRWVPPAPIPLARYITKYGPPTKSGFADDDMRPYSSWPAKGVHLNHSDDGKLVVSAEVIPTPAEKKADCLIRYKNPVFCT